MFSSLSSLNCDESLQDSTPECTLLHPIRENPMQAPKPWYLFKYWPPSFQSRSYYLCASLQDDFNARTPHLLPTGEFTGAQTILLQKMTPSFQPQSYYLCVSLQDDFKPKLLTPTVEIPPSSQDHTFAKVEPFSPSSILLPICIFAEWFQTRNSQPPTQWKFH